MKNPLNLFASKYGTDKGGLVEFSEHIPWPNHTYFTIYNLFFTLSRNNDLNVLEIGIGSVNSFYDSNMPTNGSMGASLRI